MGDAGGGAAALTPRDPRVSESRDVLVQCSSQVEVRGKRLRVVDSRPEHPDDATMFFVHGFGGQTAQWAMQIAFFASRLRVVALDFIGHGHSERPLESWAGYSASSLVADLQDVYCRYRSRHSENIIVAHSYGTSLVTQLLAQMDDELHGSVSALVFMGSTVARRALQVASYIVPWLPDVAIDALRRQETKGGLHSVSVNKFVHPDALEGMREKQLAWNKATPTPVVKRLLYGMRLCALEEYQQVKQPVLLLVGEADHVTPVKDTIDIYKRLSHVHGPHVVPNAGHSVMAESSELCNALINKFLLKRCKIQALKVYVPTGQRLHNDPNVSKWAVKNFAKWMTTQTIGAVCGARPLEGLGGLAGCKVLRQDDKKHSPSHFAAANPNVGLVIDVSSETPPYLPGDLACRYVKLPTQSKVPPNDANVASLIDITREFWEAPENKGKDIALHCHYGFNRTGYLVCCWMVEQRGYTPTAALAEFDAARPPGIKHESFRQAFLAKYSSNASGPAS